MDTLQRKFKRNCNHRLLQICALIYRFPKEPPNEAMCFPLRILCTLCYLLLKALKDVIASKNAFFEIVKFQRGIHL